MKQKTLTQILQPLVELVPKFRDKGVLQRWIRNYFPCGSTTAATIASLAKWMQSKKIGVRPNGRPEWNLGTGMWECALCAKFDWLCSNGCPLAKCSGRCAFGKNLGYRLASMGNKQPLIAALELASVYALIDELREKCEATVKEATK